MTHEFLIRLRGAVVEKENYAAITPAGSVVEAWSFYRKRRKWMEIISDLVDPRPRRGQHGNALPSKRSMNQAGLIIRIGKPAFDVLCENWKPSLREHWFHVDRLEEDALREKDIVRDLFWEQEVEKVSGFREAMGRDPTETADLIDCQPWGPYARKNCLILVNSDMTTPEAEAKEGSVDSEEVEGMKITRPASFLHWERDLGLSQARRDKIKSPNYVIHPRFDELTPKALFHPADQAPEILALGERLRARGRRG